MKINQSNLQLNSTYNYQHQIIQQETLEINKTPIADKQKEIPHDRHEVNSTNQSEQNEYADPFGIFHFLFVLADTTQFNSAFTGVQSSTHTVEN